MLLILLGLLSMIRLAWFLLDKRVMNGENKMKNRKNVRNQIIYNAPANNLGLREQCTLIHYSDRQLTYRGAQRIIGVRGSVERVECMLDAR
jgi:hypothetical protein